MAPADVMERVGRFKSTPGPHGRISVTELARGKEWRNDLPKIGVMEVTDRGETAGWLVSKEDMEAVAYAIISLEQEVEELSVAAMFEARAGDNQTDWKSGKQLRESAQTYFDSHGDEIMAIVDEHR